MFSNSELRFRLRNCLQTILEIKEDSAFAPYATVFAAEFHTLSSFINQMDEISLDEDTVQRIEKATERFLKEFAGFLPDVPKSFYPGCTRLQ